jgi:cellulose/xylan binding protein with CBM9 domain
MTLFRTSSGFSLVLVSAAFCVIALGSVRSLTAQNEDQYLSKIEAAAKYSAIDFTPDGDLSKKTWSHARWTEFDHDATGKIENPAVRTRVATVWTDRYIYFAFSARYDSLNTYEGEDISKERWELWNRDVVEVFLNPEPRRITHYYEFEVAPNNQWIDLEIEKKKTPFNDANWNSGFEHATRIDTKHHLWNTEMRIPLSVLDVASIHEGDLWRVNFLRAAGHGGDDRRVFLAWSSIPQGGTFHVPNRFGILRFLK